MAEAITASMLYDLAQCSHRLSLDLFEDSSKRDPINSFVRMLWEGGTLYEKEVIDGLRAPFLDLKNLDDDEREARSLEAIARQEPFIYGARISHREYLMPEIAPVSQGLARKSFSGNVVWNGALQCLLLRTRIHIGT